MRLTEMLTLPTFKEAAVVAGHQGLSNTVQSVNLMDAPDIIDYLNKEQLLLTTAYSLKNNPDALYDLVKQMAKQGCAGLGVKTKRFIEEIPKKVIAEADRLHFPIIELPLQHSLGEMLKESLGCILKERTDELHYALNIHKKFTTIIIEGGGFSNIIDSLSAIIEAPVILLNSRLDVMAASEGIDKDSFFEVYWFIHEKVLDKEVQSHQIVTMPTDEYTGLYNEFSLYPINTANQQNGYLILLGEPLTKQYPSLLAVEQASNVISFEFMKLHAIEQQARRVKNEFFIDLVDGTISSEKEIFNRGKMYNILPSLHYVCVSSKSDFISDFSTHPLQVEKETRKKHDRIYELLESVLLNDFETSVLFTKGDIFTMLIGFAFYNEEVEQQITEIVKQAQAELKFTLGDSFSFGISNYCENVIDISTIYRESINALYSGFREKQKGFIKTYRTKELTELFKVIPLQKLKDFYKSSLKELAFPIEKEKEDLLETLATFLNHNCQIAETAKAMFIHRNTVIYRIKKCEDILGRDIKDPDESIRLRMAFLIKSIL
ncbi:PucR family transcriptional regulator [Bacillus alkalicellulosilyticus]|uniref:PucR family transcriptional regulator n=1 Tax=Alkalihalobacterium alkalicellulosilyticum TaxID=1912214 RepID=UPI0009983499|nr:PucR family transcriptional regulator [Bacillus alkalicellulosilyticus]